MTKIEETTSSLIDGMFDRRVVVLSGQISHESAGEVGKRLLNLQMLSSAPINLIIDSGGGNTDAALRLCDLITTMLTAPVRGIALGECGSAATFVMLHCKQRVSTPFSRFLIHSGTFNKISIPVNQTTSENLEHLLHEVRATEEMVLDLYMRLLTPVAWAKKRPTDKQRRAFVQCLINRGDQRFNGAMTAKEAKDVGLIEKIIQKMGIFPD